MKIGLKEGITLELDLLRMTASVVNSPLAKGDIIIPSTAFYSGKEYLITSIGEDAFKNNNLIHSIQFDKSSQILIISKNAFAFSSLQKLYLPKSLTILEEGWNSNADKLNSIEISPKNHYFSFIDNKLLISKNGQTIFFAQKDINTIEIPTNVKVISSFSFSHCSNLKIINFYKRNEFSNETKIIPIYPAKFMKIDSTDPIFNEIKGQPDYFEISDKAFNNSNRTSDLEVTTVGESAFKPISDLMPFSYMSIAITARVTIASAMKEKSRNKLLGANNTNSEEMDNTPVDLESNSDNTSSNLNSNQLDDANISKMQLIDTELKELGDYAFANCTSLLAIRSIPSTVNKVGCYCFSGNFNLTSLEFLSYELIIGNFIFQGCTNLESVSFPNAQKILFRSMAFNGLTNPISLYIVPGALVKMT